MFLRTVKNNKGVEYLRIVENYRENGKTKQRIVANLGRVDSGLAPGYWRRNKKKSFFHSNEKIIEIN